MNRNVESHFSRLPSAKVPRSVFDRSFSHKTTFNVGDLVPILCEEVIPGDTVQIDTSKIVRMQTLLSPVFDNMYLDTYFFFVPNRILWDHWVNFMGQNDTSPWIPSVEYHMPEFLTRDMSSEPITVGVGTVADYLGLPVGLDHYQPTDVTPGYTGISALPFRAYAMIYNEFFRDQNLQDPVNIDTSDANLFYDASDPSKGGIPFKASKYHDYFTSCLPSPQKGPSVKVPISGVAPVHSIPDWSPAGDWSKSPPNIYSLSADNVFRTFIPGQSAGVSYQGGGLTATSGFSVENLGAFFEETPLSAGAAASGIDINALRLAAVTQVYYETLARGGSRYEELISSFFGVENPDLRLQHPEYLGGNRVQVNVHEIVNTAQSEQDFLGDLGAMSVTADTHSDFTKSFTEYGWLIGVCVCRYDHVYSQGVPRKFTRTDKFDFYNPVFARIGEQPIYDYELFANSTTLNSKSIFGFQEAWASYRYAPNSVSGYLRPSVDNSLGHWTLADNYASKPTLSAGWIVENKTNVDRVLAVSSSLSPQLFADFYFNARWTRPMPMYSIPGVIGSF